MSKGVSKIVGVAILISRLSCPAASADTCPGQQVRADDGAAMTARFAYFGEAVSVSGDVAIVGAEHDDWDGEGWPFPAAGSAYVFRQSGASWTQEAKLVASDASNGARFGTSVAVSGDVAVVGAYQEGDNYNGSAYVFRYDGVEWREEAKLVGSDNDGGSGYFGCSVAVEDDVVIVGAWQARDGRQYYGAAYVFRHDGSAWREEEKLVHEDRTWGTKFGVSVALSRGVALIGANGQNGADSEGAAYVFRHDGTGWRQEARLVSSESRSMDYFGSSVSLSGDVALVGANLVSRDQTQPAVPGAAFVFRHDGVGWLQEDKLVADVSGSGTKFGSAVSISGGVALVGAPGEDDYGVSYVWRRLISSWHIEAKLEVGAGAGAGGGRGAAVCLSDGVALVGAPFTGSHGLSPGAAAFYSCTATEECAVPEVSRAVEGGDGRAFTITKSGTEHLLSWEQVPYEVGVYVGTLDALANSGVYDHEASLACRQYGGGVVFPAVFIDTLPPRAYYLAIAAACDGPRREGSAGSDGFGVERPSAAELGLATCP